MQTPFALTLAAAGDIGTANITCRHTPNAEKVGCRGWDRFVNTLVKQVSMILRLEQQGKKQKMSLHLVLVPYVFLQ